MKSVEDFKRSVYAKKLAHDLKRQQRRRKIGGMLSVAAVAVGCFALGVFSGVNVPETATLSADNDRTLVFSADVVDKDQRGDDLQQQHEASMAGIQKALQRDYLDASVVMGDSFSDWGNVSVLLSNSSTEDTLQILSAYVMVPGTEYRMDEPQAEGLLLSPGENIVVTFTLDLSFSPEGRFDTVFDYVWTEDALEQRPVLKKTVSVLWQST